MISKLLTGGIDLPKLAATVASLDLASNETNKALADHIAKANKSLSSNTAALAIRCNGLQADVTTLQSVVASRALAEDVETLRVKLDRIAGEVVHPGEGYIVPTLATNVADLKISNANLSTQVASLSKQVEALTAAKLSDVKARKAPKKT